MDTTTLVALGSSIIAALWLAVCAMAKILYDERNRLVQEKEAIKGVIDVRDAEIERLGIELEREHKRWDRVSGILVRVAHERKVTAGVLGQIQELMEGPPGPT